MTCNHCPYVVAWNPRLRAVAEAYAPRGVRFLAINGNDSSRYPADSPEAMTRFVRDQRWPIPYLFDDSQDVVRALDAQVTPHVFVLDGEGLRYRGAPGADHRDPAQGARYLRDALDAGETPANADTRPRSCSVKWKAAWYRRRRARMGDPDQRGGHLVAGAPNRDDRPEARPPAASP